MAEDGDLPVDGPNIFFASGLAFTHDLFTPCIQ